MSEGYREAKKDEGYESQRIARRKRLAKEREDRELARRLEDGFGMLDDDNDGDTPDWLPVTGL